MNPKSQVLIAAVLVLMLLACVECQLTFSPDWGKAPAPAARSGASFLEPVRGTCRTSNEMLLEIFQFVLSQAQLFLECKTRE